MATIPLMRIVGAPVLPNLSGMVMCSLNGKAIKKLFDKLNLPNHRSPNWVVGPVWRLLATCLGYASYLVWRDGENFAEEARGPLALYAVKLGLNWAWSPMLFVARNIKWVSMNKFHFQCSKID
jgi:translocator protein